ncbi:trace amine-associated receptor 4-like [Anopheles bellator]|uniref:trace amine-associated receptor 4-like n=1 Tax=Anopheles bellator TaxID=139047 RepID=UPI0026493877|nr:trace amine-associated receptor 4-like [Anopheles bellator]
MVPFQLEILALVAVLVGFTVNTYIVVIVALTKQITFASKVLLLHLGIVNAVLCLFYFIFYAVSLFQLLLPGEARDVACLLFGICFNTLHSIALWTLCALNFDRYFAIATPLHYGTFINTKKQVLVTLGSGWLVSTLFSLPQALRISAYKFDADYALCLPNLQTTGSLIYSVCFVLFTILLPIGLIVGCNMKVFMIARYQRNRIASAILEVTLSAQLTITHQRNPFFVQSSGPGPAAGPGQPAAAGVPLADCRACSGQGTACNPAANVIQLVGSAILLHCPYYVAILWNSALPFATSSWRTPALLLYLACFLLLLSPTVNAVLYGVRSKIVRRSFRNIWRKQKQKMEIHYEIQARTPSTCGSRRPSFSGAQLQQQQQQQQQQPLLLAFADGGARVDGDPAGPDGSSDQAILSPLSRTKFGSCSALGVGCTSPPPIVTALAAVQQEFTVGQATATRPKITITKILPDDEPAARARLLSDSSANSSAAAGDAGDDCEPLASPTTTNAPNLHHHHHQQQQQQTDNLCVATRQSSAKLPMHPPATEPKLSFKKFSSLQEILGNGTD